MAGALGRGRTIGRPRLRTRRVGRFPYLALYVETADRIEVWRVLHASRDSPAALLSGGP